MQQTAEKQTAVEWFDEQLDILLEMYGSEWDKVKKVFEQAKEMEKQQIENAFTDGVTGDSGAVNPEQYYKETFNK